MAISISIVISAAIALVAIVCVLISFVPTYFSGIDAVQGTVDNLREMVIASATASTKSFFNVPVSIIKDITRLERFNVSRLGNSTGAEILGVQCDVLLTVSGVSTFTLLKPYSPDGVDWMMACDTRFGFPYGYVVRGDVGVMRFVNPATRQLDMDAPPFAEFPTNKTFWQDSPMNTMLTAAREGNGEPRWLPGFEGFVSVTFPVVFAFDDGFGGTGFSYMEIATWNVVTLLNDLELRSGARALMADHHTRYLIGVSWNESIEILHDERFDFNLPGPERMTLLTISDMQDGLARRVVRHLGGEDALYALPTPHATTMGSGADRVFVDIANVSDAYGLRLLALVAMPERDFLEDVYRTRTVTIVIVVVCVVVMLAIAVVFSIALTHPLQRIGERMERTASLCDDDADDAPSVLSEIRVMQAAYATMKAELNRMKVYLPQSVLVASGDEDDEEGESAEGTTSPSVLTGKSGERSANGDVAASRRSDTRSQSSRISRNTTNSKSGAAGGPPPALRTSRSALVKKVAVASFNLVRFHDAAGGAAMLSTAKVASLQTEFLVLVMRHVRDNKGVVDHFQGDHITCSFNAVSNVVTAAKRASVAALAVAMEVASSAKLPPVSIGIAYGTALVGNMGSDELQRFNIIGPVAAHAAALERLAAQRLRQAKGGESAGRHCVLLADALLPEVGLEMYFRCVDLVRLPGNTNHEAGGRPTVVAQLLGAKSAGADEWQYVLEASAASDRNAHLNEAFLLLKHNKVSEAAEQLRKHSVTMQRAANETARSEDDAEAGKIAMQRAQQLVDLGDGAVAACAAVVLH